MSRPNLFRRDDRTNSTRWLLEALAAELGEQAESFPDDLTREQLEAALACCRTGNHGNTLRLLRCFPGPGAESKQLRYCCKQSRICTYCRKRWAWKTAESLVARVRRFTNPVAVLITAPSRSLFDLGDTLEQFKANVERLRRKRRFREECSGGVLVFECPLLKEGHRWNVHAHAILDVPSREQASGRAFEAWLAAEWRNLGGVKFEFQPLLSARLFIEYALKLDRPSSYSNPLLSAQLQAGLERALYRKRRFKAWGPPTGDGEPAPRARARKGGSQ